ncbi:MAG: hypothetical protein ACLQLG_15165 [Thermoguttaceae bacterium]
MQQQAAGPLTQTAFQTVVRVARRIANETTIHPRRVSIPRGGGRFRAGHRQTPSSPVRKDLSPCPNRHATHFGSWAP